MYAFQDWRANSGRPKIQISLVMYRVSLITRQKFGRKHPLTLVVASIYRLIAEVVGGFELPTSVEAGRNLQIHHGFGLVINGGARIGSNVILRQGVCIGSRSSGGAAPVVGDAVDFGVNAVALGEIRIGQGARIGAAAVVLCDVPDGHSAVGNPARVITPQKSDDLSFKVADQVPSIRLSEGQ